jgi:hypothetical protein
MPGYRALDRSGPADQELGYLRYLKVTSGSVAIDEKKLPKKKGSTESGCSPPTPTYRPLKSPLTTSQPPSYAIILNNGRLYT